ncbi:MAG: Uncharacterised protein [SAR116 cluster bacterium]|nr:MAG: Uncharacterised protein [SAR116 cluster bacterium]
MRTTVSLVGKNKADCIRPVAMVLVVAIQHLAVVIMVHDGNIALALENCLGLCAVIALRTPRHIGDETLTPLCCNLFTVGSNHRRHQRPIIDVASLSRAYAPTPLRIGQILKIADSAFGDTLYRGHDNPGASRKGKPAIIGSTQMCGDIGVQHIRRYWRQQIQIGVFAQPRDINGEDHIGGACLAFCLKPLRQPFRGIDNICLNTGFTGERIEEGLQQELLAVRIDIHLCRLQFGRAH